MPHSTNTRNTPAWQDTWDVFWRFLLLGCTSFGGPAAHLGYFRTAFVVRLNWLSEAEYAHLLALSQFLPGPGSSQVGFAIGQHRAGLPGAMAAFIGFTLPSFLIMTAMAVTSLTTTTAWVPGVILGLKWLAVVVVFDAVTGMFARFCDARATQAVALLSLAALVVWPGVGGQLLVLVLAATWGASRDTRTAVTVPEGTRGRVRWRPLSVFLLLAVLGMLGWLGSLWAGFYQTGALVFGGGHVVLPLLQATVGDAISQDAFLLGYAVAQALPGPLFSLAAYLGALLQPETPMLGATLATLAIFIPGFLLLLAVRDYWQALLARPRISGAVNGINAAVVGLLMAALYQPVFLQGVQAPWQLAPVVVGVLLLRSQRVPLVLLVLGFALSGVLLDTLVQTR